jgi:predicted aldo/keto reductase-like oxidoreductase
MWAPRRCMPLTASCRKLPRLEGSTSRDGMHLPKQAVSMARYAELGGGCPRVLRLGLATRGNTHLKAADVAEAVAQGVNYLNWCGHDDGLSQALRERLIERRQVVLAMQLQARDAPSASREVEQALRTLATDRIDIVTFYYVEDESEWDEITRPGGAFETLVDARRRGQLALIGLTTHQRTLGANWIESGKLDLLMLRYNAAHRGAEQDVFPVTDRLRVPVVAFTAQRWGALRAATPDDPPGFKPAPASDWYRFALAQPSVSVVLMAPANGLELHENLALLQDWRAPDPNEFEELAAHGRRVRKHVGAFP